MNRCLLLVAAMSVSVLADNAKTDHTNRPRGALRKAGGMVSRTTEGGKVVFVNGSGLSAVSEIAANIQNSCGFPVSTLPMEDGNGDALQIALKTVSDTDVSAAIVISASGIETPALIVCPEEGVATINVDSLFKNLPKDEADTVKRNRLMAEMWRAVAFVLGGYDSGTLCAFSAITDSREIDNLPIKVFSPQILAKVVAGAERRGVARIETATYYDAVRRGWAPAPTNDIQKAIWDRVKAEKVVSNAVEKASIPTK